MAKIPVERTPQAFDALFVRDENGAYIPVNAGGGGSGPGGAVAWDDIADKPESAMVDTRQRANHIGTQPASSISDLSDLMAGKVDAVAGKGLSDTNYTQAEKTKLAGIATSATANDTNANLRDRSTHTGTQTAGTISDLPDLLATKVTAVAGKMLSDSNFTQAEKEKLAGLEDGHFKGVHVGLAGLTAEHPTAVAGDYAVVDDGADLTWYQWSVADTAWTPRTGESTEITPAQVKQYYEQNPDTNAFTDDEKAALSNLTSNGRFTLRRRGTWNPLTNTPALLDGEGTEGDFYVVTAASSYSFGNGTFVFMPRDWVLFSGGVWQRIAITDSVSTVNGKIGTVALTAADVGAKPSSYTPTWAEVSGKPNFDTTYAKKTRGGLSAPIEAGYFWTNSTSFAVPSNVDTTWVPTNFSYDFFSMLSGGVITLPSWATRFRVSGSFLFPMNPTGHRTVSCRLGDTVIYSNRMPAISAAQTPVAFLTPVWPIGTEKTVSIGLFQSSGVSLIPATSSWINIELFEANT